MRNIVAASCAVALCMVMPGGMVRAQAADPVAIAAPSQTRPSATIIARGSPVPGTVLVERNALVRLMVVNEVSTKAARPGDRFVLRVDEDLEIGGVKVVPVGTKAWGEVLSAEESGVVGKAGKLTARLLYIDLPNGRLPIRGEQADRGPGGTGATVLAVVGLGVFGLFTRGTNAKLKAGEIFNGYVAEDMIFDPVAHNFLSMPATVSTTTAAPQIQVVPVAKVLSK
jgi:hypothetical protein